MKLPEGLKLPEGCEEGYCPICEKTQVYQWMKKDTIVFVACCECGFTASTIPEKPAPREDLERLKEYFG